jgi:MFS superfamily sulfate permease-like transporter
LAASTLVLPFCIAYGLLLFGPLGPEWSGVGIAAALISAAVTPWVAVALGQRGPIIHTPRAISAIVFASFLLEFGSISAVRALGPPAILGAAVLYVALLAAFEGLFGLARIGRLAKYLPAPVVAGFVCGAALVLMRSQVAPLLGYANEAGLLQQLRGAGPNPLALTVACTTLLAVWWLQRRGHAATAYAWALAAASAMYALLTAAGLEAPGATLGPPHLSVDAGLPLTAALRMADFQALLVHLPRIAGWALTGAVMSVTGTLVGLRLIEEATEHRVAFDGEMRRGSLANLASAALGGAHGGINVRSTEVAYRFGARGTRATLLTAMLVALAGWLLMPLLPLIPRAAVAALLMLIAASMFDEWTLNLIRRHVSSRTWPTRDTAATLAIVAIVASVALVANLLAAMLAGIALAVVAFIWRISRSIVRRSYTLRQVQSRTVRSPEVREMLLAEGERVVVIELEGSLFFGTGDKLVAEVDRHNSSATLAVIVDLQRLTDIDATAARLITQLHVRLQRQGKTLALSGVPSNGRIARLLRDFGVADAGEGMPVHHSVDRALQWAEELVLRSSGWSDEDSVEIPAAQLDVLRGLSAAELAALSKVLQRREFAQGELVFRAGDASRALYAIVRGSASVILPGPEGQPATRVVTFSQGAIFGEFALLDSQPRSATVQADAALVCYVLEAEAFEQLQRSEPTLAIRLLANLGRELALRLRSANQTIRALAH